MKNKILALMIVMVLCLITLHFVLADTEAILGVSGDDEMYTAGYLDNENGLLSYVPPFAVHAVWAPLPPEIGRASNLSNLTTEELAVQICTRISAEPIRIGEQIYCRKDSEYIPIQEVQTTTPTVSFLGLSIPNFGRMLMPGNESLGWIVFLGFIGFIIYIVSKKWFVGFVKARKKAEQEVGSEQMNYYNRNDKGKKRRHDGGFY
jgi:hypothetical protein